MVSLESQMNRKIPVRFGPGEKAEIISKPYLSVLKGRAPVVRFVGFVKTNR